MLIKEMTKDLFIINANDIRVNGASLDEVNLLKKCFTQTGILIIEDVFDYNYIDQLKRQFDSRYSVLSERQLEETYKKLSVKRYMISVEMEPPFDDPSLYASPVILAINRILLGEDHTLDSYTAVLSLSGSSDQVVHRDNPGLFEDDKISSILPTYAISVAIPLVDMDMECGTTALVPSTHTNFEKPSSSIAALLPLVKRGSVYIWDYRLFHAGLANNSQSHRPILTLVYSKSWWTDSQNFTKQPPLHISKTAYEKIPDHARFLFDKFRWQRKE